MYIHVTLYEGGAQGDIWRRDMNRQEDPGWRSVLIEFAVRGTLA